MERHKRHQYTGDGDGIVVTLQFSLGVSNSGTFTVVGLESNIRAAFRAHGLCPDMAESATIVQVERLPVEKTIVEPGEVLYEL